LEEQHTREPGAEEAVMMVNGNQPDLFNARLKDGDLMPIVESIVQTPTLVITTLDLSYNELKEYGALTLVRLLTETSHVMGINLAYNDIGTNGCIKIAKALQEYNKSLTSLDLSGNTVGDEGGMAIAEMLTINRALRVLKLNSMELGTQSIMSFATVLNYNKALQVLEIENPRLFSLHEETAVHLGKMLRVNDSLQALNVAKHGMRDMGVHQICTGIVDNQCLTALDLRWFCLPLL
jgi:Ran GTPase-activating protein (RanGAP) involved in mRNA processing and transport